MPVPFPRRPWWGGPPGLLPAPRPAPGAHRHSYIATLALLLLALLPAAAQPAAPEQLFHEALAAQQRGDDATAIAKYRELLKLRPDAVQVRANLGAALAKLGRFDEAIAEYRVALAANGANPGLRFNLALAYYKKGDFAEAARELEALHRTDPSDIRIATLLGDCYTHLMRDTDVIATLAPAEAAHPDDLGIAWLYGSALIRAGRAREGLARVEKAAKGGNQPEAYLLAGQTALKLNQFERARDNADAALRLNPHLPGLYTLRGTILQYLGDNAGAIQALRLAIEANPNDFDAQLTLGAVLNSERDLEGARQHLDKALQLNPKSTVARYELARTERTQGQVEAAMKDLEQVVREKPEWAQPHLDLAGLYFRLKREEDGQRERAVYDRLTAAPQKNP